MNTKHFLRAVVTASLTTGFLASACDANEQSSTKGGQAARGGILHILTESAALPFDPAKSQNLAITALSLVHRRLTSWHVAAGRPTSVVPDLATDTGRSSDGGRTWTFTLKNGLVFSDGSPITSRDVKWGLQRSFAPAFAGGLGYHKTLLTGGANYRGPFEGKELDSVQTPDDKTIVFHLSRPYGDWSWIASTPAFAPVPKGKGTEPTYGEHPVASGPYQVKKFQQGVEVRLTRNSRWNRANDPARAALPDQVVFELGQQPTIISQRLIRDSEQDRFAFGASVLPPAQLAQIQRSGSAKQRLVTSKSGALDFLALNTQRGPLTDPEVRQAFQYAVDKSAYQVASAGSAALAGDIATTLITSGGHGRERFNLYPAPPTGAPERAERLLAQNGHPNGLDKLRLLVPNADRFPDKAQAVQAALARANIKVTIRLLDYEAYEAEVTGKPNPDYDLTLVVWQPDFPSPNASIQPLFASSEIGKGGYNLSRLSDPEVDKLIEQAQSTLDPALAGQKWAEVDNKIMQDSAVVPLIHGRNSFLHGSKVANFVVGDFPAYPDYRQVGIIP